MRGNWDNRKEKLSKMRPEPDFKFLAHISKKIMDVDVPLARDLRREPGKIPGFDAPNPGE